MFHYGKRLGKFFAVGGYLPRILLATVIGLVTGLVAVAFHYVLELACKLVRVPWMGDAALPWWSFAFVPVIGGLIVGLVIYKFTRTPEAAGQGTDNMIRAFHCEGGAVRARVAPVKFFTSIVTLASGGSAGYEGPISQIGSGIGSSIARFFRLPKAMRGQFMLAGTAAGLGAIFKAPLAGALTSVEVLYREDFESNAFMTSIVSSVVAFTVYIALVGTEPAIAGVPAFPFTSGIELLACAVLGVLCFPFSFLYVRCYDLSETRFARWKIPDWLKPAVGGAFVGAIILAFPQVAGGGFDFISDVMRGLVPHTLTGVLLLLAIAIAKIVATAFTVGSGGSGGVFGPSLFIGGVLGAMFAGICELLFPGAVRVPEMFILVGMAAFFAGAAKAPIAGVVMVCEMTGSYSLLPGLMIAAVMHIAFSRPWTIYKSQVLNKFASPAHRCDMDIDVLQVTSVGEVMEPREIKRLDAGSPLSDALKLIDLNCVYPVYDRDEYAGILDMHAVKSTFLSSPELARHLLVSDCTVRAPMLVDAMDLHAALKVFTRVEIDELCVKDRQGNLVGTLSHSAIFRAYETLVNRNA